MNFVESAELLEAIVGWDWVEAIDDKPDVEHVAWLAANVQKARAALAMAEDDLAQFLWKQAPVGEPILVDGEAFRMRGGTDRKAWDHGEVKHDLVPLLADRLSLAVTNVERVIDAWTACCGYSWKTTGLKDYGLDPDEYCQATKGPPKFTKA